LSRQAAELLRSREALAAQAKTLQLVLDNINDGVIAADNEGKFVLWNPAADRILGKTRCDAPPQEWVTYYRIYLSDRVTPFPYQELPLFRAIQGLHASAEMFVRHGEQERGSWIEAAASPIRDLNNQVQGGVVAFRDITQRVLADREIRRLNAD